MRMSIAVHQSVPAIRHDDGVGCRAEVNIVHLRLRHCLFRGGRVGRTQLMLDAQYVQHASNSVTCPNLDHS
jgi:hypothetical protein